jgi:hypothetical protein
MKFDSFDDRFEYLKLDGVVGHSTFGFDRYINQKFYTSYEWKQARREVIVRDNGCDLGIFDRPIIHALLVHHMNPIDVNHIVHAEEWIIDPEYLILTSKRTHDAIHFGNASLVPRTVVSRRRDDTKLW